MEKHSTRRCLGLTPILLFMILAIESGVLSALLLMLVEIGDSTVITTHGYDVWLAL